MQDLVKVRISSKLVADWKDRGISDEDGMPNQGGTQTMTQREALALIKFLKEEVENYRDFEMPDFQAAAKRQIQALRVALEKSIK